eukprot:TRINITY_DN14442_c0_g1_i1.p1 TRINITY_DN14442_c0_g1~~TRINITY_DN14442_c0_g1_i1.p1  ORF type:complete len:225 (-),score=26.64 TRINITY_DN14442_c0_g1_i1:165-839(-)
MENTFDFEQGDDGIAAAEALANGTLAQENFVSFLKKISYSEVHYRFFGEFYLKAKELNIAAAGIFSKLDQKKQLRILGPLVCYLASDFSNLNLLKLMIDDFEINWNSDTLAEFLYETLDWSEDDAPLLATLSLCMCEFFCIPLISLIALVDRKVGAASDDEWRIELMECFMRSPPGGDAYGLELVAKLKRSSPPKITKRQWGIDVHENEQILSSLDDMQLGRVW